MIIQGQNEGQKGGRAVKWTKGGEEKLIGDHDAALANGQDYGKTNKSRNNYIQHTIVNAFDDIITGAVVVRYFVQLKYLT